jgi:predicted dehydrogenase
MEKPFVPTLQQSDELVALCQQHKVKLALACQSHYSPRVQMAKQLIAEGKIGRVLEFRGRGKEDHRGGSEDLWVLGTHILDLIRYLGGQPTSCFATLTEQGRPVEKSDVRDGNEGLGPLAGDSVQASYTLPAGATAFFASRRNMGKGEDRFGVQIFGSEGIIEIMWGYLASVLYLPDPQWSPGRSGKKWLNVSSTGIDQPEPNPKPGTAEGNRIAVLDLLDAIQTDREPLCGLTAAAGTLEMIHAVFESHRLRKPTPLPLTTRQHPLTLL